MKVVAASRASFDRYLTDGMKKYSTEIRHDEDLSSCNDVMVPSRENSISNERTSERDFLCIPNRNDVIEVNQTNYLDEINRTPF